MQRRSVIIGKPKSGQTTTPYSPNWGSMLAIGRDAGGGSTLVLLNNSGAEQSLAHFIKIGDGGGIRIITHDADYIYAGGYFTGTNQNYFTIIRKSDFAVMPFAGFNAVVTSCVCDDNYVYVGGSFTNKFAIIRKSDFTIMSNTPTFDNSVWGNAIADDDTQLYVGGSFTNKFAIIRKSDFTKVSGTPTFNNYINAIADDAENIYVGGAIGFSVIRKYDKSIIYSYNYGQANALICDAEYIYIGTQDMANNLKILRKSDFSEVATAPIITGIVGDIYDDANYVYIGTQNKANNFTVIRKSDFSVVPNTLAVGGAIWSITTI